MATNCENCRRIAATSASAMSRVLLQQHGSVGLNGSVRKHVRGEWKKPDG